MVDAPPQETGFNKRTWGLPLWGWVGLAAAGAVITWVWWRNRKTSGSDTSGTNATATPNFTDTGLATDQYEALLAQLRDIQGNTSTPNTTTNTTTAGLQFAKRKDQPDNLEPIAYKATESDWTVLLNNHYTNLPGTDPNAGIRHFMSSELAHLNNAGGAGNPKGKTVRLPLFLPYASSTGT